MKTRRAFGRVVAVLFTCEICRQPKPQQTELVELPTRPGRVMRVCRTCEPAGRKYVAMRFGERRATA
jgi:hypothetical protein